MKPDVLKYLDKDYKYLSNDLKELNEILFSSPHSAIIKGRIITENILKEISSLEKYELYYALTQAEKLIKFKNEGILVDEIYDLFNQVRLIGNKAAHTSIEGELEPALNIHKDIYKIICWFIEAYVDFNFESPQYKSPIPITNKTSGMDKKMIEDLLKKIMQEQVSSQVSSIVDKELTNIEDKNKKDKLTSLNEKESKNEDQDLKCLVQELSKLRESSKEAVEGLVEFSEFKRYMHIEREAQKKLEGIILRANKSEMAQLILVSGSVGDGKSHIISYFNNEYPKIMDNFILHNDATESLEPNKTSTDTLNEILNDFSDEKIEQSNKKLIIAINLGTLNNFIDSKYGERFSILKDYVRDKKIIETSIEYNGFDENSSFQFINFSDYHVFTLNDGKVHSEYIESLISKITDSSEFNIFYNSYKKNCINCSNSNCCPIKLNYELLRNRTVQNSIIELLVEAIIKSKIIISTRALINFIYELIIPITYIDINVPTFKNNIAKLNNSNYIKSLMPNIIFDRKELSFIFEALNTLDPLDMRNQKIDDFIITFNNSSDFLCYFKEHIDFPDGFMEKINTMNLKETEDEKIKHELLKLFIRSYSISGNEILFSLKDGIYEEYMKKIYLWNKGEKFKLEKLYENVKNGILKWNGEADKDQINIFMGKNQIKYNISQDIQISPYIGNLLENTEKELKKFITTLELQYKSKTSEEIYEIDIDFALYKLLNKINNGYRPNIKDKNHFVSFIEFINKLEETGSQNQKIIFKEKNREYNRKYKLEYNPDFEIYRFVEM